MAELWMSGSIVMNKLRALRPALDDLLHGLPGPVQRVVKGVELGYLAEPADIDRARHEVDDLGLDLGFHHPVVREQSGSQLDRCITSLDAGLRAAALALVEQSMVLVRRARGRHLVVHAPSQFRDSTVTERVSRSEYRTLVGSSLEGLDRLAREYDTPILIETDGPNPFYRTPAELLELIVPYPHLGHCLDTMHFAVLTGKYQYPCSVGDLVRATAPYTCSIHLSNTISPSGTGADHRPPGSKHLRLPVHPDQDPTDGWVDIAGVIKTVLRHNPDVLLVMEHIPYRPYDLAALRAWGYDPRSYARDGLRWLASMLEYNGC